jgi:2-C-methyl-D-erythritol 4-phosphate cytidylyltransferase
MIGFVLVAGGRGRRYGGALAKQFLPLAGVPLLVWSARRLATLRDLGSFVVVATPEEHERCRVLLAPLALSLRLADAGAERQQSVASGLAALEPGCEIVVVHDAVRPLVDPVSIAACVAAAHESGAAMLAIPIADTVKRADGGIVTATVPREGLWLAQTPQVFRSDVLRRAHHEAARLGFVGTDDAALVERLGLPVRIVEGSHLNRKITTPDDLAWAEAIVAGFPHLAYDPERSS